MVSDTFFPFHSFSSKLLVSHADLDKMSDSDSDGVYHDTSQDVEDHVASVSFRSNNQSKHTLSACFLSNQVSTVSLSEIWFLSVEEQSLCLQPIG